MNPDFDIVLVGSSPLIILEAILKSQQGLKICVIDSDENYGGSWSYNQISSDFLIEQACHLIEPVPDIYSILESFSGVSFTVLNPQPVRFLGDHFSIPYSSKLLILLAGFRVVTKFLFLQLLFVFKKDINKDILYNYRTKTSYFFRTQLAVVFSSRKFPCQAPVNGYADWVKNLITNAKSFGVVFRNHEVIQASYSPINSLWSVSCENVPPILSRQIGLSSSTNLRPSGSSSLVAESPIKRTRHTALFSIPYSDVITPHSYIAFTFDKYISRASRIESENPKQNFYYLVELKDYYDPEFLSSYVNSLFYSISLQSQPDSALLKKVNSFSYLSGRSQLRIHTQLPSFKVFQSFGNLACGISQWETNSLQT